ncbi:MAG TPA: hypothetical protein QF353_03840 [Gammaproteobacteria bacterium]|nr:hypothetical protein [Gammaproteobacteria bacterium]
MRLLIIIGHNQEWAKWLERSLCRMKVVYIPWKMLMTAKIDVLESLMTIGLKKECLEINQDTVFYFSDRQGLYQCYQFNKDRYYQQAAWQALIYFIGQQYPTINPINPNNSAFSDAFYISQWSVASNWQGSVPSWSYQDKQPKGYQSFSPGVYQRENSKLSIEPIANLIHYDVIDTELFRHTNKNQIDCSDETVLDLAQKLMLYYGWQVGCITIGLTQKNRWVLLSVFPELKENKQLKMKAKAFNRSLTFIQKRLYISPEYRPKLTG